MQELPTYRCPRAAMPPVVDGRLDDPCWAAAPPAAPFIVASGAGPAQRQTTARACWDDRALYVAFDCVDRDIWSDYRERDEPVSNQEVVEIFLGTSRDDLSVHYALELSPRNVLYDGVHTWREGEKSTGDNSWDCAGVRTATHLRGTIDRRDDLDEGWSAELEIPFAGLGVPTPRPGDVWRVNFYRIDRTPDVEYSSWSSTLTDPAQFHIPPRFGYLVFA